MLNNMAELWLPWIMPGGFTYKKLNDFMLHWSLALPVRVRVLPSSWMDFWKDRNKGWIFFVVVLEGDRSNLLDDVYIDIKNLVKIQKSLSCTSFSALTQIWNGKHFTLKSWHYPSLYTWLTSFSINLFGWLCSNYYCAFWITILQRISNY